MVLGKVVSLQVDGKGLMQYRKAMPVQKLWLDLTWEIQHLLEHLVLHLMQDILSFVRSNHKLYSIPLNCWWNIMWRVRKNVHQHSWLRCHFFFFARIVFLMENRADTSYIATAWCALTFNLLQYLKRGYSMRRGFYFLSLWCLPLGGAVGSGQGWSLAYKQAIHRYKNTHYATLCWTQYVFAEAFLQMSLRVEGIQ